MSPSWTDPSWWRQRLQPEPELRVGLAIGRTQICAVELTRQHGAWRPQAVQVQALAAPSAQAGAAPALDRLEDGLRAVAANWARRYAAVHVALPDTVLRAAVFELEAWPRAHAVQQELLRWHFARLWQRDEDSLQAQAMPLGQVGAAQLLLAQAGDAAWLAGLRAALGRVGIEPWSLNAALVYRFNAWHEPLVAQAGALLTLDADAWSLLLWDAQGRARVVLTRLRRAASSGQGGADDEGVEIAREAERAILAFVQAGADRQVGRLHLAGDPAELAALGAALDARLHEPVRILSPSSLLELPVDTHLAIDGLAELALAAALSS